MSNLLVGVEEFESSLNWVWASFLCQLGYTPIFYLIISFKQSIPREGYEKHRPASNGIRTRSHSLEGCHATIEHHRRIWWRHLDSNQGTHKELIYSQSQLPLCYISILVRVWRLELPSRAYKARALTSCATLAWSLYRESNTDDQFRRLEHYPLCYRGKTKILLFQRKL